MTKHFDTITYLGHSAVLLTGRTTLAIDPWLQGNPMCPESQYNPQKLDFIVLTHGHADHAGDAVRLAKQTKAKVIATFELANLLAEEGVPGEQLVHMNKGGEIELAGLRVRLTHAFHSNSFDTSKGPRYAGEACGVIVSDAGSSIYHAGDTALFSDLKLIGDIYQPQLALLPIGDRFTMNPKEAALAAKWLNVKRAIPIHYATFPPLTGTAPEFIHECEKLQIPASELKIGEPQPIESLIS